MALFSKYVPIKNTLDQHLAKCKKVFAEIGDRQSAALVDGFLQDVEKQRFCITIMGSFNRGKSTLLNTLMERSNDDISPIDSNVCTSAIVKYLDKNLATDNLKEHAVIYYEDEGKAPLTIPLPRLRDFVTEERNPQNRKGVRSVEVYGDFPEWSKAVTIVDSPGQNAVYDYHDALMQDFLPYTDAIIFLISADLAIDSGDLKLLEKLVDEQSRKKIFFVITKADSVNNPNDLEDVKDRVESILVEAGFPSKVYCTSAKSVFDKMRKGCKGEELDNAKFEYGILELERDLEKFIVLESDDNKIFAKRFKGILEKTKAALTSYQKRAERILSCEQIDLEALQVKEEELTAQSEELRAKLKTSLKKFDRDWTRAVGKVHRRFSAKAGCISDRICDEIDNSKGGLINTVSTSFTLKQKVYNTLYHEVQDVVQNLEEEFDSIVQTLTKEYDEAGAVYLKKLGGGVDASGKVVGLGGIGVSAGVAWWAVASASAPVVAAKSALLAWAGASGAVATAEAGMSVSSVGCFPWVWSFLTGTGARVEYAVATANAAEAGASAVGACVGAVVSLGMSIVVTLVVSKILKFGLTAINKGRVEGVVEEALKKMEDQFCTKLEDYRKAIIDEYSRSINDLLEDKADELEEVRRLISKDNSAERELVTKKLQSVQLLIQGGDDVQGQLALL